MENQEKKKSAPQEGSENTKPKKKRPAEAASAKSTDSPQKKKRPANASAAEHAGDKPKKKRPANASTAAEGADGQVKKKRKKRPPQVKETGVIPTKEVVEKLAESEEAEKTKDEIKKRKKTKEEHAGAVAEEAAKPHKKSRKKKQKDTEITESAESVMDDSGVSVSDDVDEAADGEGGGKFKATMKKIFKWFFIIVGSIIGIAALLYLCVSIFFMGHFYYGTTINGIDYSLKSVKYVENDFKQQVEDYVLTIEEKQNVTETISGKEISLEYVDTNVEEALKSQNAFLWPIVFFEPEEAVEEAAVSVTFDQSALDQKVLSLKCITEVEQTEPISAYPKFDGEQFVPEPEQTGLKVDPEAMKAAVSEYISGFQAVMNMEEAGGYALPKYVSDSPELLAACDEMNAYCKASITYTFGEETDVVDAALISTWVSCDEELNVTFNPDLVREYMVEFGKKHDTVGTTRKITTPTGKEAEVNGGTYGWSVDEDAETEALIAHIENGEVITKEPAYVQTAASHGEQDWGTSYVEVDLTTQHMWYIAEGEVQFEADVVTGLPIPSRITPEGVYSILEKLRNKTLRGAKLSDGSYEYETPVAYWMRVTYTGIGFHDATWQPWFGGTRYKSNGSHGCINMSYNDAATLYGLIPVGIPVVIHY